MPKLDTSISKAGCVIKKYESSLEGKDDVFLRGEGYWNRYHAIQRCAMAASQRRFPGFAVRDGGECLSDDNVLKWYGGSGGRGGGGGGIGCVGGQATNWGSCD